LANIKSQIKRNKQNEKRRLRNRVYRGKARIAVRDARKSMETVTTEEEARTAVLAAVSALDFAAEKGVIHKNNAARRKGRLMKRLASLDLQPAEAAEPQVEKEEKPAKKSRKKKSS
jgi:small subunit ribosomal protein S20